jgi:hypothetical protein
MRFPKGELAAYGRSYHEAAQHLVKHIASTHYRDKHPASSSSNSTTIGDLISWKRAGGDSN